MTGKTHSDITGIFKGKNAFLIILGLCAGGVLIILSFFFPGKNNEAAIKIDLSRTDTNTYIAEQEKKLCEILKRVNGISEPYVMITLESSSEYIYASQQSIKENSTSTGTQREVQKDIILYSDIKNEESPILVKEIQPKIKGVAVVCKGVSSADTELRIINLVSTVLNLPTNRVYVISSD